MTNVAPLPRADAAIPLIAFRGVSHMFGNRAGAAGHQSDRRQIRVRLHGRAVRAAARPPLLRMVGGLQTPTIRRGDVRRQARRPGRRSEISFMFQDYSKALLPWRTAAGNVSLALEANGVPSAQRARAHQGSAGQGRARQPCRSFSGAAFGRHAAARADRALPRAGAFRAADGRAVRRARRHDAAGAAG